MWRVATGLSVPPRNTLPQRGLTRRCTKFLPVQQSAPERSPTVVVHAVGLLIQLIPRSFDVPPHDDRGRRHRGVLHRALPA